MKVKHEDGYRVHVNPDGSGVFLEGFPPVKDTLDIINDGTGSKITQASKRLCAPARRKNYDSYKKKYATKLKKLGEIMRLEHAYCGEEDW